MRLCFCAARRQVGLAKEMIDSLIHYLSGMPKELIVMILAALPISELRGSIPAGLVMKMPVLKVFWLSLLGNMIPVIPCLILLNPVSERVRHLRLFKKFFDWLFERAQKNAKVVQRYETLGLAIFVGIPLPMTGAWSGCVAASLFKLKFRYAFLGVFLGVILAGLIVMSVCLAGKGIFYYVFTSYH